MAHATATSMNLFQAANQQIEVHKASECVAARWRVTNWTESCRRAHLYSAERKLSMHTYTQRNKHKTTARLHWQKMFDVRTQHNPATAVAHSSRDLLEYTYIYLYKYIFCSSCSTLHIQLFGTAFGGIGEGYPRPVAQSLRRTPWPLSPQHQEENRTKSTWKAKNTVISSFETQDEIVEE